MTLLPHLGIRSKRRSPAALQFPVAGVPAKPATGGYFAAV